MKYERDDETELSASQGYNLDTFENQAIPIVLNYTDERKKN